jgi:hypothetical protein
MAKIKRLGLLVLFAASTLAAPFMVLDEHLPRAQLKDDGCNNLRFPTKGQKFMYDYAGETLSQVAGSSERNTGMKIQAQVSVSAVSKCSFVMEVTSAKLTSKSATDADFIKHPAESDKLKQEIEKFSIRFDLGMSGEVEAVMSHAQEPTHILNMKRGIVSQLQLDVNGQVETDVNGICDVHITNKDGGIIKEKDLAACSKRAVNEIGLQSSTMQSPSDLKPLASKSKCTYQATDAQINSVICEETHVFRPFSAGFKSTSGAVTTVKTTLKFNKAGKIVGKINLNALNVPSTLSFDHESEQLTATNTITQQVDAVMAKLVAKTGNGYVAQQNSARDFQNLVTVLRKMDEKRLTPVYNQYIDCIKSGLCKASETGLKDIYRQFLLDAVTYCGTPTCISMIRNVIINGQISGERMNMFLQGIALVGKTDVNMVRDVLMIAKQTPSRQAFLTLGTLIHRQCSNNEQDCHYDPKSPITQAETFLEGILGQGCEKQEDHEQLEQILMALKAIGNSGRPVSAFNKVLKCASNSKHGNLTVAAFDAIRRMPCDHKRSEQILAFVSDEDTCPEKRIHAFKALVKCPDVQILHKLIHRLEVEPSKQLGSFMWTTLTNIMESSDSKHALCQKYLTKLLKGKSLKEINMPMHQFSKNYEKSFQLSKLDSGVTAEGDLIFNPQGYLPRAAFFNLTANVMGVPVHVVEASAQVNGMETLLEDVFGPDGMFPDNTVFKMFNFTLTKEKLMNMAEKRNERQDNEAVNRRTRRSAANSIEENLKDLHKRASMKRDIPTGSLSFKVMGQEIRAISYDDLFWAIDKIDNMNVITMLLNVAKGGKKSFSKSMLFLEMSHSVPTGMGLPLKLKLVGSTVSSVELEGKFDIRNMFWGPSSMTIKGSIKPSASVEITGQMGIFSRMYDTGVYVSNTMHTSQFLKGAIVYKQGQMLKVNLDTPDEPVQLFNFSSTPFMFHNEDSVLIEGAARKINPDFCTKSVVLGFGLCTSLRVPVAYRDYEAPYYPLSGPSHFGMKLVKADAKLTTYEFLAKLSKRGDTTNGILSLSTPGATYERKIEGDMSYTIKGTQHTLIVGSSNALGNTGKRTEIEASYDTVSHSVKMAARSDLLTKTMFEYDFSLFNETNPTGRAFGARSSVAYGKYKYSAESKMVATKTGGMLITSATYYPGKSVTGTLELNTISNKVYARIAADQFKQLAMDLSGQYIKRGSYRGVEIIGKHVASGKKASIAGGLDDGKLIITGDVNGKSAKTVITVTSKKVGVMIEAVGNKAEVAATLDNKQFSKILALQAIVNGKGAKLTGTVAYKSDKVLTIEADVMGKKASGTVGLYTPGEDVIVKASATIAGKTASSAAGYYVKAGKKTWKVEADVAGNHAEMYTSYSIDQGKTLETAAAFNKYVAGLRTVYTINKGNSLCSSMYYSTGKNEITPFQGCARYIDFGHDHKYIHKELILSADMKAIKQNLETKFVLESHPGHTVIKTTGLQNGVEKMFSTIDATYGDMKNSQLKLSVGSGKKTMSAAVFSKNQGNTQSVGTQFQVLGKSIAFVSNFITLKNDWTLKNVVQINGRDLPVSSSVRYYRGEAKSGTELSMTVKDISVTYASTFENGVPEKSMNAKLSVSKAGKELGAIFKNSILTWSLKEKSFEQQLGAIVNGKRYQYGYTFQLLDKSSASKSAMAARFILAYSTGRSSSLMLMVANGAKTMELHGDIEYLPGSHLKQMITYNKVDKKLDVSFELLPKMFVKYSASLNKLQGFKLSHDLSVQIENAKNQAQKGYTKSVKWVNEYIKSAKNLKLATKFGKNFDVSFENKNAHTSVATLKALNTKAEFITTFIPSRNGVMFRFLLNNKEQLSATAEMKNGKAALAISRGKSELEFIGFYIASHNKITLNMNLNQKSIIGLSMKKAGNTVSFKVKTAGSIVELVGKKEGMGVFLKFNLNNKIFVQLGAQVDKKSKTVTLSSDTGKTICGMRMRADYINLIAGAEAFCNKKAIGWEAAIKGKSLTVEMNLTPSQAVMVTFEVEADRIIKITVTRKSGDNTINVFTTTLKLTPEMFKMVFNLNKQSLRNLAEKVVKVADATQNKVRKISRRSVDAVMEKVKNVDLNSIKLQGDKAVDYIAKLEELVSKYIDSLEVKEMITKARAATKKSLEEASKTLEQMKAKMPEIVKQVVEIIKTIKAQIKAQVDAIDMTNVKKIAKEQLKELAKYNKVLAKKVEVLAMQLKKIAQSIAKSSRPVIAKAIKLAKDFKIRNQTLESVAKVAIKEGEKYIAVYVELAKGELKTLTKEGQMLIRKTKVFLKENTKYVMKMKLPLCGGRTTEQCIEIIYAKFQELRKQLNTEQLRKLVDQVQKVVVASMEENLVSLNAELKNLPAVAREALKASIKTTRTYLKEIQKYKKYVVKYEKLTKKALNQAVTTLKEMGVEVSEFIKPLTNYAGVVSKSVQKNFGPLAKMTAQKIKKFLKTIDLNAQITPLVLKQLKVVEKMLMPLVKPIAPLYNAIIAQIRQLQVLGVKVGPMFDMKLKQLQDNLEKYIQESGSEMSAILKQLNKAVETVAKMTPEKMVDVAFDQADKLVLKVLKEVKTAYKQRKVIMEKTLAKAQEMYTQLNKLSDKLDEKSVRTAMDILFNESGKILTKTSEELKQLADQLAKLDLVNPTMKAWKDVIGQLKSYGINEKIIRAIEAAKKMDPSKTILKIVKQLEQKLIELKKAAIVKAMIVYNQAQDAQNYIKSIPKKSYDDWFAELQKFVSNNQMEIINYFQTMYGVSKKQAETIFATLKSLKIDSMDYDAVMEKLVKPAKEMGEDIAERTRRVRRDIAEPTQVLADKVAKFSASKYEVMYNRVIELINKLRVIVEDNVNKVSKDVVAAYVDVTGKVMDKIEVAWTKFNTKYGNMTWEQVGDKIYSAAEKQGLMVKEITGAKIQYILNLINKLKIRATKLATSTYAKVNVEYKQAIVKATVMAKDLQKKAIKLYKDLVKQIQAKYAELKPKVIAGLKDLTKTVKKIQKIVITKINELKKSGKEQLKQWKEMAVMAKNLAIVMYEQNKQKTIRQVYTEMKIMGTSIAQAQYQIIMMKVNKKIAEATVIYNKYAAKVQAYVPEIKEELVSITNQLVKASSELSQEIATQFAPQYNAIKAEVAKIVKIVKAKIEEIKAFVKPLMAADFDQMKKEMTLMAKKKYEQLVVYIKELVKQLKKKFDHMDFAAIEKLQAKVDQLVKVAKKQLVELKNNPRIQRLRKLAMQKLNKIKNNPNMQEMKVILEKQIKQMEKMGQKNYAKYSKIALVQYKQAIKEYKQKINDIRTSPTFVKALKTLTKLQKSADFTISKLAQKITPLIKKLIKDLTLLVEAAPVTCNKVYQQFKANPEKTFWTAVEVASKTSKKAMDEARKIKPAAVKTAMQKTLFELADECTDDYAKATASQVVKQAKKAAKVVKDKAMDLKRDVKQTFRRVRRDAPAMAKKYMNEATKQLNQLKQEAKVVFEKAEKTLKPVMENKIWGEIATEINNHEITQLIKDLVKLIKQGAQIIAKETKIIYKKAVAQATIVYKQVSTKAIALWNANFPKVLKQVEQIKKQIVAFWNEKFPVFMKKFNEIKKIVIVKCSQMKTMTMKCMNDMKIKFVALKDQVMAFDVQKAIAQVERQIAMLQKVIPEKIELITKMLIAKYKELQRILPIKIQQLKKIVIAQVDKVVKDANVFLDTTKLVDIEKFVLKTVTSAQKVVAEVTKQIMYLKNNYKNIANKYMKQVVVLAKYQVQAAKAMINKYKPIVIAKVNEIKAKAIKMVAAYKAQALKLVATYKPVVMKAIKDVTVQFNKYKTLTVATLKKYQVVAMKMVGEAKSKAIVLYKQLKTLVLKFQAQAIAIYKKYLPIAINMVKDYETQAKKLVATIKPKVEAMIKQIQAFVLKYKSEAIKIYKQYAPIVITMAKQYQAEAMKQLTLVKAKFDQYKPKFMAKYEEVVKKVTAKLMQLYSTYKPQVEAAIKKVQTLAVMYKNEAVKISQTFIKDATKKMDKVVKMYKPKVEALVQKAMALVNKYKSQAEKLIAKYQPIVRSLIMKNYEKALKMAVQLKKQILAIVEPLVQKAKVEAEKMVKVYKPKVEAIIKKIQAMVAPIIKKYTPMIRAYTDRVVKIVKMCLETTTEAYKIYAVKVEKIVKELKSSALDTASVAMKMSAKLQKDAIKTVALIKNNPKVIVDFIEVQIRVLIKMIKNINTQAIVKQVMVIANQIQSEATKTFNNVKSQAIVVAKDLKVRWNKCMTACKEDLNVLIKLVQKKVSMIKAIAEATIKNPEFAKKMIMSKLIPLKVAAKKQILKLKAEIEKIVKVIVTKAVEIKTKVEKQIATFDADKLVKKLTIKAMELKSKIEAEVTRIAKIVKVKVEECVKSYSSKAAVYIEDLKLKALKIKLEGEKQITLLKMKIEKIIAQLTKQAIQLRSKALNAWQTSSVRASLITLKKMTISETILAIKNLPAKAKKMVLEEFQKIRAIVEAEFAKKYGKALAMYKDLYAKALAIYQEKYAQAIALYNKMSAKAMATYKQEYARVVIAYKKAILKMKEMKSKVATKLITLKNEITTAAMPSYLKLKSAVQSASNEIKEAVIFGYKYFNVEQTVEMIKSRVESEYKRIDPMVRRMIIEFLEMLKKELTSYKLQAEELTKIYKKQGFKNMQAYKTFAVKSLKKNFANAKVASVKLAKATGHTMLRSVHSAAVAIDNVDTTKLKRQARSIVNKGMNTLNKYVDLDAEKGILRINVPHGGLLKGTFKGTYNKLNRQVQTLKIRTRRAVKVAQKEMVKQADRVQKAVESIRRKAMQSKLVKDAQQAVKTAQKTANNIQKQMSLKSNQVYDLMMKETTGIRRDINQIIKADSELINHVIAQIKQLSKVYWKKAVTKFNSYKIKAMFQYKKAMKAAQVYVALAKKMSTAAYKQGEDLAMTAYKNPGAAFQKALSLAKQALRTAEKASITVYNNPHKTYNQAVAIIRRSIQLLQQKVMKTYKQTAPMAKLMARKYYKDMKSELTSLKKEAMKTAMPYYNAVIRMKNGEAPAKVLRPFLNQAERMIRKTEWTVQNMAKKTKRSVCTSDRMLCRLIMNSFNVNKQVMDKYASKLFNALMFAKVQSDRSYRQTRVMLSNLGEKSSTLAAPTYQAVGMVFGKSHVVTFDQKYYDMIDYKAPDCSYVLAHDFTDGKFTILRQESKIVVKTPGMTVKIGADGKTKTVIDGKMTESLPVKSDSGVCMRYGDFIKCYFMQQKFKVTVDLKHFAAVIGLSGWHHGKSQGLLGTNNRESYDEWKMPNGKVTSDIYQLANAYEVTQKRKCIAKPAKVAAPACNKRPSARCEELFKSASSPYARLFSKINPEAFLKACQADSSDCENSFAAETSHCNATAAFVMYARAQWAYAAMPSDCNTYQGHKVGSSWTQKPLKRAVDVVVLVSERTTVGPVRNLFAKTVSNINLRLARTGYKNVRFALIGFGGHEEHEKAHIHPLNGKIFAKMPALAKEIKTMPYSGEGQDTNDAYHAILKASALKFRPGASRVFIMYNTVPHVSHEHGPTYDEAMHSLVNEANATLFVLDKLVFKNLKKHTIIGQSNGKMYTSESTILPLPEVELPASEFKQMVKATNGGLFSNKIRKSKVQRFAQSIFKGMSVWLKKDSQLCKKCTLSKTWYGVPTPICVATAC